MASKNDITGDTIQSKETSDKYRDNYDEFLRKKDLTFWEHYCTIDKQLIHVEKMHHVIGGLYEENFIDMKK